MGLLLESSRCDNCGHSSEVTPEWGELTLFRFGSDDLNGRIALCPRCAPLIRAMLFRRVHGRKGHSPRFVEAVEPDDDQEDDDDGPDEDDL